MRRLLSFLLALLFITSILSPLATQDEPWKEEVYRLARLFNKLSKGVVYCYSGNSTTTGFFVSKDGWILTAGHKVNRDFPKANKIQVRLKRIGDDRIFESTDIIPPTREYDLLLFKIDYKPEYYFRDFRVPNLFEENWVIGFRQGADICVSHSGYVTIYATNPKMYYTTASVFYGNSGSPAINGNGKVIGVAVGGIPSIWDGLLIPGKEVEKYIKENLRGKE